MARASSTSALRRWLRSTPAVGTTSFSARFRSLGTTSTGGLFAKPHVVNSITNDRPLITSAPVSAYNTTVGLYLCHRVNGVWSAGFPGSGSNDTSLLWCGRVKSVTDSGDGSIAISCTEITEKLSTKLFAQQFTGKLRNSVNIDADTYEILTDFLVTDLSTGVGTQYDHTTVSALTISQNPGDADAMVADISTALLDRFVTHAPTYGPTGATLSIGRRNPNGSNNGKYTFGVRWPSSTGIVTATLWLPGFVWDALGWADHTGPASSFGGVTLNPVTIGPVDLSSTTDNTFTVEAPNDPPPLLTHSGGFGTFQPVIDIVPDTGSSYTDFVPQTTMPAFAPAGATGFLLVGDKAAVAVEQLSATSFKVLLDVTDKFNATNQNSFADILTNASDPSNIQVKQLWIEMGTIGQMILRIMASTGTAGFNHPTFDVLPRFMGVGIPWSLLDADSISNLDSSP